MPWTPWPRCWSRFRRVREIGRYGLWNCASAHRLCPTWPRPWLRNLRSPPIRNCASGPRRRGRVSRVIFGTLACCFRCCGWTTNTFARWPKARQAKLRNGMRSSRISVRCRPSRPPRNVLNRPCAISRPCAPKLPATLRIKTMPCPASMSGLRRSKAPRMMFQPFPADCTRWRKPRTIFSPRWTSDSCSTNPESSSPSVSGPLTEH